MTQQKNKKVFFLGSGFSKSLFSSLPTLSELSSRVASKIQSDPNLTSYWNTLKPELRSNIEQLLSFLLIDNPWEKKTEQHLKKSLFFALTNEIQKDFKNNKFDTSSCEISNIKDFLSVIQKQKINVLTTNYDNCFEKLIFELLSKDFYFHELERSAKWDLRMFIENQYTLNPKIPSGAPFMAERDNVLHETRIYVKEEHFRLDEIQGYVQNDGQVSNQRAGIMRYLLNEIFGTPDYRKIFYEDLYQIPLQRISTRLGHAVLAGEYNYQTTHYVKLHGSINWYYSGSDIFPGETIYYSTPSDEEDEDALTVDLEPLIVPPISDKTGYYFHNSIKYLWAKAKDYLKDADEIYFIGYSLPQTDFSIRMLLETNIKPEAKIVLINSPSDSNEKDQLIANFKLVFRTNPIDVEYVDEHNKKILENFIEDKIIKIFPE